VTYAFLADGRDATSLQELDMALAPTPEAKEELLDRANMEAMKQLEASLGGLAPGRPRR
jgi:hypothetical protein